MNYYIKRLFEDFESQICNCGKLGKKRDAEIIAQLIFTKYGGEDMTDVLTEVLKILNNKNHFLPKKISII